MLQNFTKVAKHIGLDNFKKLVCGGNYTRYDRLNVSAYKKAMRFVDAAKMNPKKYAEGLLDYTLPKKSQQSTINYYSNFFEKNAFKSEFDIICALEGKIPNTQTTVQRIMSELSTKIQARLKKLQKLSGPKFSEANYFTLLEKRAGTVIDNHFTHNANFDLLEEMIKILDSDIRNFK